MIILMSTKQWKKNCKKLVKPKDYVVLDATDAEETDSKVYGHYNNTVMLRGLNIPPKAKKLVRKAGLLPDKDSILYEEDPESYMDSIDDLFLVHGEKLDKIFINYYMKNLGKMDAVHTVLMSQLDGGNMAQVFIVFKGKDYEIFSRYFVRMFNRILQKDYGKDADDLRDYGIVFKFEDWKKDPELFEKPLKDHQMNVLKKTTDRLKEDYCDFDLGRYQVKVANDMKEANKALLNSKRKEKEE